MSLLLAGLTVLVIGDSHMTQDYLIATLHDNLLQQGAHVYSYGACGTVAGDWVKRVVPPCGSAFRLDQGKIRNRTGEAGTTLPLPDMVKAYHPDLLVVINGDDMAAYRSRSLPKQWVWSEVAALTRGIKASGVRCVWVGPAWGQEGGRFDKTYLRVREMSDYLAGIVSPCVDVDSLEMSRPGEWPTSDGVHFKSAGYQAWGDAIAGHVVSALHSGDATPGR